MAASIKMALIAIASVLFQFGLAILGGGGFSVFFSHPALDALAIATVALTVVALFAGGNISSGEEEDRSNRWVLVAFSVIAILIAYLPAYTDRNGLWTIDGDSIRWVGVALLTAGGALRIWPVYVLGNRFSGLVAIQHGHKLVTSGIYGVIRNPSYLGLLISTLGWALAFRSEVGVVLAAMMIPPLVARMSAEERLLRAHFGSEYDAYCKRTWRLIPRVY
jgi:protein-S-isoprenylcysteine O-methyltransferase Ste14